MSDKNETIDISKKDSSDINLKIVSALSRDYLNVYLINPDTESFKIIKLNGYITDGLSNSLTTEYNYQQICNNYVNSRVHPDDRKMMHKALSMTKVLEKLKKSEEYIGSYRTIDEQNETHYYQYKYIRIGNDGEIIAGFQNVDEIVSSERKQAAKLAELLEEERIKNTIISSLASAYICIYYLDLKTKLFKEISPATFKEIEMHIGESGDAIEKLKIMAEVLVKPEYKQTIEEFSNLDTLSERLKNRNSVGIHFDGTHAGFCEGLFVAAERDKDGNVTHVLFVIRSIKDEMEKEIEYRKKLSDSLNETEHQKQLLQKALEDLQKADIDRRTDFLTGLKNRQDMFNLLNDAAVGKYQIEAMFMMDIDNFKMLNDSCGHLYGDECLRLIGAELNQYGKKNKMYFCRYGGEEMLGISFKDSKSPEIIAQELVNCISSLGIKRNDPQNNVVTISLGYTTDNSSYEEMLEKSDTALYIAKRTGKNKAVCFDKVNP